MEKLLKSSENKYKKLSAAFVFIILIIRMLFMMPKGSSEMSDPWSYLFYIVNYKTMGFVPRALIGSICTLFTGRITGTAIYIISLIATVFLIFLFAFFIYKVISYLDSSESLAFLLIISIWLFAPNDIFYIFDKEHFGITDIFFFMLTLLAVVVIKHKYFKWLFPLIMALGMAVYEGYFFAFGAVIAIVLLYMIFKSDNKAGYITLTVVSAVTVIAAFLYFYIFFRSDYLGVVPFENSADAINALKAQTDMEIPKMLEELYFWDSACSLFFDGRWNVSDIISNTTTLRNQCLSVFFLIYAVCLYLWISAFRSEKDKKIKAIYIFCALAPLGSVPLFVFSQQMKYSTYMLWGQLILVGFFAVKEKSFSQGLKKIGDKLSENPSYAFLCWIIMIFLRFI